MEYAVVMKVKFVGDMSSEQRQKMLDEMVVPHAKSLAGFQRGTWMHHESVGTAVVVFDSDANAKAAQSQLSPPPDGPELTASDVFEVGAQA